MFGLFKKVIFIFGFLFLVAVIVVTHLKMYQRLILPVEVRSQQDVATVPETLRNNHQHPVTNNSSKTVPVIPIILSNNTWMPQWQKRLNKTSHLKFNLPEGQKMFLSAAFRVRIYADDKAKWTVRELKQWFHYMFWAGVEHIFLCDHYRSESEILRDDLQKYIKLNLLTYMPWDTDRPHTLSSQVRCYQKIIDDYGKLSTWQVAVDMDEFPYVHNDTQEGFLKRYLSKFPETIAEVSMPNFVLKGQGDRTKNMTIDRIDRIESLTKKSSNLDKPLYRPECVRAGMHHNGITKGRVYEENGKTLKMLHYWGARTQNWGPDTKETLESTVPFTEVREKLAPIIRQSLLVFGEVDAFSNSTGP